MLDLSKPAITHEFACQPKPLIGALLAADLEYLIGGVMGFYQLLALFNEERKRLFTVDVLACLERGHRNRNVPVIRRAYDNGVDILARKQFTKIVKLCGIRAKAVYRVVEVSLIQIADCDHLH